MQTNVCREFVFDNVSIVGALPNSCSEASLVYLAGLEGKLKSGASLR